MLLPCAIPRVKHLSQHPRPQSFWGFFSCFSHITLRTDSLRMILWMASTMRKSPPSFLRMLTAYPGQIWRLCPQGKRPGLTQSRSQNSEIHFPPSSFSKQPLQSQADPGKLPNFQVARETGMILWEGRYQHPPVFL